MAWICIGILSTLVVMTSQSSICDVQNGGCDHNCVADSTTGEAVCSCRSGYHLMEKRMCHKVDPCAVWNGGCQQKCTISGDNAACLCFAGYNIDSNMKTCSVIDACASKNGGCAHECTSVNGTKVQCGCQTGYQLDDDFKSCYDLHLCEHKNGGCQHTCLQTGKVVTCSCNQGYITDHNNAKECIKVCSVGNGGCQQKCTPSGGHLSHVTCSCYVGYTDNPDGTTCTEIDACVINNKGVISNKGGCAHECTSVNGTKVQCGCQTGYQLDDDFKSCYDLHLCDHEANGGCQQGCLQTGKDVTCSCNQGYFTDHNDLTKCIKDLCALNNGGCEDGCDHHLDGDKVVCSCHELNEELNEDGRTCREKDLCRVKNGGCGDVCKTIGGLKVVCSCNNNRRLNKTDMRTCYTPVDYCQKLVDANTPCDQACINLEDKHQCSCKTGYALVSNGRTCLDIRPYVEAVHVWLKQKNVDHCGANNGGCAHTCVNTLYEKECVCDKGYKPEQHGRKCTALQVLGARGDESTTHHYGIVAVVVIAIVVIILVIVICLCARLKYLNETICCKSYISWKCCMTGCFCKWNKGEASDATSLHYHQVSINVKEYAGDEDDGEDEPDKL